MNARLWTAIALITVIPTVATVAADEPQGPAQGTCFLENDEYLQYPGLDKVIVIEIADAARKGVYDWNPENPLDPTNPQGWGWTQFTGSCSLIEDVREFVRCNYTTPGADECDAPADPNLKYFVLK